MLADLAPSTPESAATLTQTNTLELIEALVSSASESAHPDAVTNTIQRALEELLSRTPGLDAATRTRVAAVVEKVAAWHSDGSLGKWRHDLLHRLDALESP